MFIKLRFYVIGVSENLFTLSVVFYIVILIRLWLAENKVLAVIDESIIDIDYGILPVSHENNPEVLDD